MKKIKLLISLILINFGVYAQHLRETIPTADEFLNFLKENNFKCDFMDIEMLYENYGYNAESDISGFLKAINSYCECIIPKYFNEFNLIKSGNDNFIKHLKANGYQDFQFTSLLAFQVFKNIGLIPMKLEQKIYSVDLIKKFKLYGIYAIEVGDTSSPQKEIFRGEKANKESKPWSNLPTPLLYGSSHQIKYSAVQEHDYSKNVDDFNLGDRTVTKIFFDSKDELTKSIYYELVYEDVGGERIWSIVDLKKDVVCEDDPKIEKNSCGECVYKKDVFADINFNTDFDEAIIKFIGDWGEKIKKALIYWDYSFGMYREGIQVKYAIANAILGESLIVFLERIFDAKVFLSGPHNKDPNQLGMNFNSRHEFGRYNPVFIRKLIISANEILSNPVYLNLIKPIYEKYIKNMALTYQATNELLKQHYLKNPNDKFILKNEFLNNIKSFKSTTGIWSDKSWTNNPKWAEGWINESTKENPNNCLICNYSNSYYRYTNYDTSLDFWGRRNIDGSDDLISKLLDLVIEKLK